MYFITGAMFTVRPLHDDREFMNTVTFSLHLCGMIFSVAAMAFHFHAHRASSVFGGRSRSTRAIRSCMYWLCSSGAGELQGYLFARPLNFDDATQIAPAAPRTAYG